jgi:hypothetical protein
MKMANIDLYMKFVFLALRRLWHFNNKCHGCNKGIRFCGGYISFVATKGELFFALGRNRVSNENQQLYKKEVEYEQYRPP